MNATQALQSCAGCARPVSPTQPKTACEACMGWLHAECAALEDACPACGAPVPLQDSPAERSLLVREQALAARERADAERAEVRAGLGAILALVTAVIGAGLIQGNYSPEALPANLLLLDFGTPQGFHPLGQALIGAVTLPFVLLSAGLCWGSWRGESRVAAASGLAIDAAYLLGFFVTTWSAFH